MTQIFLDNWAAIALALITAADVVVSMTPTKKDDQIVGYLRIIFTTIGGKRKK